MRKVLCINQCPVHSAYWCVSIDDLSGGDRVTSGKCCGRWKTIKEFGMSSTEWERLAKLATEAAKLAKEEEKKRVVEIERSE